MSDIEIQPLKEILNVECADGEQLPYLGFVVTDVDMGVGLEKSTIHTCLFLIVPDTRYSAATPIIIGTNILTELLNDCKDNFGTQFLQRARLQTPWYLSFRTMVLMEKELKKKEDRVAIIRSAVPHRVVLKPNATLDLPTYADKKIRYPITTVLLHESKEATIPAFIDVTPGIVNYCKLNEYTVTLSNLTTCPVCIEPRAIVCELQPVKVEETVLERIEKDTIDEKRRKVVEQVEIDEENNLSPEEKQQLRDVLLQYRDIFSTSDTDIGQCNSVKHRIYLIDDIPFKQRHRRIPPSMVDEVRQHLEQLLACGIIRPSKSPWSSPVVLVRKKNGKLRMCVDYRMLNNKTVKDAYALPRIEEVFDCLRGAKFFSSIDMKSGYHQVEMEERHKERTIFTVGPLGFWEYNKMPFGLSNSPATHQRLAEDCLGELNMTICVVYIDDLIIFSQTLDEHLKNLHKVFAV